MIVRHPEANGVLRFQDGILVTIINADHSHDFIRGLCNDPNAENKWTPEALSVLLTLRMNGQALSAINMTNNSKLLNTSFATVLSCNAFLAVLRPVVAYERTFKDAYEVPFCDARMGNIPRYLMASEFIPPRVSQKIRPTHSVGSFMNVM